MKDGDIRVFMTKEERNSASTDYVELMRYYNVATDEYVVVANGQVEILHMPLISYDGKKNSKWGGKTLPFTSRQYMRNVYGFYGMGIPEIVLQFKSKLNILEEMLMDAIKRSSNTVFAIGNNLQFDGNGFALNNQILKFDGDLTPNNFQQISGTPPNGAIFSHRDNVFRDLAVVSGIDIRNELDNTQTTAYQTAVEKETQQKRLNLVFSNKDTSYQRIANQHRCNLQMFFPQKMVREMTDDGQSTPTYPSIPMNGELRKKGKFIKKAGKHLFEVKPEDIMGDIGIEVYTDINTTAINEVEKAQKLEFFNALQGITALYAQNP